MPKNAIANGDEWIYVGPYLKCTPMPFGETITETKCVKCDKQRYSAFCEKCGTNIIPVPVFVNRDGSKRLQDWADKSEDFCWLNTSYNFGNNPPRILIPADESVRTLIEVDYDVAAMVDVPWSRSVSVEQVRILFQRNKAELQAITSNTEVCFRLIASHHESVNY